MFKYTKYKIGYTLNGKPESIEYWTGLEMTSQLASIVIFKKYFDAPYEEDRLEAEEKLAVSNSAEYLGFNFGGVSWVVDEEKQMTNKQFRAVENRRVFENRKTQVNFISKVKRHNRAFVNNAYTSNYIAFAYRAFKEQLEYSVNNGDDIGIARDMIEDLDDYLTEFEISKENNEL